MAPMENVYSLIRPAPACALPLLIDSPHSGRHYPDDFGYSCPLDLLKNAEDNHVDDLVAGAPAHGATFLCALFPRTYIDVNRSASDIDPALLGESWPGSIKPSRRSHAGHGLIRRLLRPGLPVYNRKLKVREIQQRLESYYKPYHGILGQCLDELHYNFGVLWHINAHAMPAAATNADFVLSDRDGRSCDSAFIYTLRDILSARGYSVALNHPYKGAEILRRYGAPPLRRHSLQMEINKALYWDENKGERLSNYTGLKADLDIVIGDIAAWVRDQTATTLAAD